MLEILIAFAIGATLVGSALIYALLPWETAVTASAWMIAAGMALGVPSGFYYHLRLRRLLRARGALPSRWWLRPFAQHELLNESARRGLVPWFIVGGLGFVVTVAGCVLVAAGVLRVR